MDLSFQRGLVGNWSGADGGQLELGGQPWGGVSACLEGDYSRSFQVCGGAPAVRLFLLHLLSDLCDVALSRLLSDLYQLLMLMRF